MGRDGGDSYPGIGERGGDVVRSVEEGPPDPEEILESIKEFDGTMTVIHQPVESLTNDRATWFLLPLVGLSPSADRARRCVNAMSERNRNVERSVSFFLR